MTSSELRDALEASFRAWAASVDGNGPAHWFPATTSIAGLMLHIYGGKVRSALSEARRLVHYLELLEDEERHGKQVA